MRLRQAEIFSQTIIQNRPRQRPFEDSAIADRERYLPQNYELENSICELIARKFFRRAEHRWAFFSGLKIGLVRLSQRSVNV